MTNQDFYNIVIAFYKQHKLQGDKWFKKNSEEAKKLYKIYDELLETSKACIETINKILYCCDKYELLSKREQRDLNRRWHVRHKQRFTHDSTYYWTSVVSIDGETYTSQCTDPDRYKQSIEYNIYIIQCLIRLLRLKQVQKLMKVKYNKQEL